MYKSNFNPYLSANNPKIIVEGNPTNCVIIRAIINCDETNPISVPKAKAILTTVSIPSIYNQ